jgi:hypothetical protein
VQALVLGYEDGRGKNAGAIGSLICRPAPPCPAPPRLAP